VERGSPSSNIDQLRDTDDGLEARPSVSGQLAGEFEAQVAAHELANKRDARNQARARQFSDNESQILRLFSA
jgi:hypothetical protein